MRKVLQNLKLGCEDATFRMLDLGGRGSIHHVYDVVNTLLEKEDIYTDPPSPSLFTNL